jgi:arylformamidase
MKIYDITLTLSPALPVYPGDSPVVFAPLSRLAQGDLANVTRLQLTTHSGTHLDAARHFDDEGGTVDHLPLTLLVGPALVVEIGGTGALGRNQLQRLPVRGHERLLFKTANSHLWEQPGFSPDYTALAADGAEYLVECGVKLVGIDYLSIEPLEGDGTVHRLLLAAGTVILEGLNLAGVEPGEYELICLPLKVAAGDGAPARAILRSREDLNAQREFDPHSSRWPLS